MRIVTTVIIDNVIAYSGKLWKNRCCRKTAFFASCHKYPGLHLQLGSRDRSAGLQLIPFPKNSATVATFLLALTCESTQRSCL
ncbi:hypothetical protein [Microcoleus sp. T3_B1]|uniref:hypothetical protein n=1 Tax=Microcoleus sp. T3_B1 TaxID=3055425 RepID=UPI002FD7178E